MAEAPISSSRWKCNQDFVLNDLCKFQVQLSLTQDQKGVNRVHANSKKQFFESLKGQFRLFLRSLLIVSGLLAVDCGGKTTNPDSSRGHIAGC